MIIWCHNNTDCQSLDPNSACNTWYTCHCSYNFVANPNNGYKCDKPVSNIYNKYCHKDYTCSEPNQRCIDSRCECKPNYYWNISTQSCERFHCYDIQIFYSSYCKRDPDNKRHCDTYTRSCVCDTGYTEDPNNGNKCISNDEYNKILMAIKYDFTWVYILVAFLLIILLFYLFMRKFIKRNNEFICN